jgi:carotenoid cleavage dioxygenase
MNAFNEGTRVSIDVPRAEGNMFPFFPELGKPWDPRKAASRLTRWTVDMGSNSGELESARQLTDFVGEFPRNDDRYQMAPYRHGWILGFGGSRNSLGHIDLSTGKTSVYDAGEDTPLQEPCFIPRRAGAPEGDGYVIQTATRAKEMRTDVFLYEALDIEAGPIATIRLPIRLRPGYHTSWADGSKIAR